MKDKLVSIIIPTHKGSHVICRAIESVLNQTYPKIEIIIIDDNGLGTPEQKKTEEKIEKYKRIKNVIYVPHKKNLNGSAARNTGIGLASGEYITFLDDDDEFLKDKIQQQVEVINKLSEEWGMVYCSFFKILKNKKKQIVRTVYYGDILEDFLLGKTRIGSSLIMFRTNVLKRIGLFDETFSRHQDWEFIARVSKEFKVAFVDKPLVNKYIVKRNSPRNAEDFKSYRIHYLEKIKSIICSLEPEKQRSIYEYHYSVIAYNFLKSGNIKAMY